MTTMTFDTHQFIKTLKAADFTDKQAEGAVTAFKEAQSQSEIATKGDVQELEHKFDYKIDLLREELKGEIKLTHWMLAVIMAAVVLPIIKPLLS